MMRMDDVDFQEAVQEVCARTQGLVSVPANVSPPILLGLAPSVLCPISLSSHVLLSTAVPSRSYLFLFPIALVVAYLAWRFTLAN